MTQEELQKAEEELKEGETLPESGKAQAEATLSRLQNGEDILTITKEMEADARRRTRRNPPTAKSRLRRRPTPPSTTMW